MFNLLSNSTFYLYYFFIYFVLQETPKSKGHLFGLPQYGSSPSSSTSWFSGDPELRVELAEKKAELKGLKMKIQTIEEERVSDQERL